MMESIWTKTARLPRFPALEGDTKTDVLIIGGGITGLLCAHRLEQAGVPYLLVEGSRIGRGVSANTTAKITAQHGLVYHKLLRSLGKERTRMYLDANRQAVKDYRRLCRDLDCDWEEETSFVYSRNDRAALEEELCALETLGAPARFVQKLPLPFVTAGAVSFPQQAQFHPVKFMAALAKGLNIRENTRVLELAPHLARTNCGWIRAKSILVATHFPLLNKHGSYFAKLYQERSYVLALENVGEWKGMYVDASNQGLSFRGYKNQLILGSGCHRTGAKTQGWQPLEVFYRTHYPQAREVCRWANQDCISLDHSAYIGRYSLGCEGLYAATGFNKWGMTSSMVAASLLTDQILGKKNPYAAAFDPSRSMLHPQLAVNLATSALHLLTPTRPRCPHLGCTLQYNQAEHSWDCPCHGSRFDREGRLLDNPATGNLSIKG